MVHFKTYVKWVLPFNVIMIGFSPQTQTAGPISRHGTYLTHVGCKRTAKDVTISGGDHQYFLSLSIRRFWGKGDGRENGRELKERNAWHRCFYWSLPPPHSMIPYHPIEIISSHWVVSLTCKSHLTVWPSSGACVATISLFSWNLQWGVFEYL